MSEADIKPRSTAETLHLLNKAPDHARFSECLDAMGDQDYLLLMENAVVALADSNTFLPSGTGYLLADVLARGLGDQIVESDREALEYADMVRLTDRFQRIVSW